MIVDLQNPRQDLSDCLDRVLRGETVVLRQDGKPVAEMRPVASEPKERRPVGLAKGQIIIHPEFFDPLPDDLLDAFEGKAE